MRLVRAFLTRLRGAGGGRDLDLALELDAHIEMLTEDNIRAGLPPEEARRQASIAMGGAEQIKEECRDRWSFPWLASLRRDLGYGVRVLAKSPTFTITAILTLALGIGANTAIFSLMNAILLRNLPVSQPQQLVFFGDAKGTGSTGFWPNGPTQLFSYPFFRQFRRENQVFSDVAAIASILFNTHGRVGRASDFEKINVELVSGSYFNTLGVNPLLGRTLSNADDRVPGQGRVAVANYAWWQRRFAGNPKAVGNAVTIGSTPYVIVGVAPPEFFGVTVGQSPDLWIPLAMQKEISPGWNGLEQNLFQTLHVIARLKPGMDVRQAQTQTNFLFRQILRSYAGPQPDRHRLDVIGRAQIELTPASTGRSQLRVEFSSPLKALMVVVALVLLIACANVANLLLARATVRQREIAVRLSIGAARSRLIRQLLVESGLLGVAGSALGIAFAWAGTRVLLQMVSTGPDLTPVRVTPDVTVLAFTLAVTILTVLIFGVVPALRTTATSPITSLKEGRGATSPGRNHLAGSLVVGQVALSLVLLVGAGLFLRTLSNLMDVDTGFDKRNVVLANVDFNAAGYHPDAHMESTMKRVEERVGALPGVRGASFAFFVFDGGGWTTGIDVPGRTRSEEDANVDHNIVGPHYLDAMKMPVLLGRPLSVRDDLASKKVAVINETMARTYFPGVSPLGRTFGVDDDMSNDPNEWKNVEVVGVVKDAKYEDLEEKQMPAAFYPHAQHMDRFLFNFVVRYAGAPDAIPAQIRKAVQEVDPNLPTGDMTTLARRVDGSVTNKRLAAQLCTFFSLLAAFLACIGIYGVTSWSVARRSNEFGLRMALGSERRFVLWIVLRGILGLVIAGVAIGIAFAAASSRVLESLLFGLKAFDPTVMALAIFAMAAVALFAGYLPARRATRIDPMTALRYE
jgi:predicted permease